MKFCFTTLMVKNLEKSLKFYKDIAGLNMNRRFNAGPGVEIAFIGDGETKIELICNEDTKKVSFGDSISIAFEVSSVDEMMTFAKEKGITIHSGPFRPNAFIKFFYVLDPNGLKIQLVENIC